MSKLTKEQQKVWDKLQEEFVANGFSNPTVGATYFNMIDKKLYVYCGSEWEVVK